MTLGSKGLKQSGVVPTWWDTEMGSRKQEWAAEGQWTRVARPWLRSAYCAWLQSPGRKEIHLNHWGRAEAGAVELRNSATGGEEEGAEDWVVAIAMLGPSPCLT